jgi:hypothetical protein
MTSIENRLDEKLRTLTGHKYAKYHAIVSTRSENIRIQSSQLEIGIAQRDQQKNSKSQIEEREKKLLHTPVFAVAKGQGQGHVKVKGRGHTSCLVKTASGYLTSFSRYDVLHAI